MLNSNSATLTKTCDNCSKCIVRKHEASSIINRICMDWLRSGRTQIITSNNPCGNFTHKGWGIYIMYKVTMENGDTYTIQACNSNEACNKVVKIYHVRMSEITSTQIIK